MENSEKRVITPELVLKNTVGIAPMRGLRIAFELFFICLFGFFILLFLGFIGFLIDVAVIVLYVWYKKNEKKKHMTAYFRTMPLVKTGIFEGGEGEDAYNIYKADFGTGPDGKELWAEFGDYKEYGNAVPGEYFYVGFYRKNDVPFICYKCDNNVLGPGIELR